MIKKNFQSLSNFICTIYLQLNINCKFTNIHVRSEAFLLFAFVSFFKNNDGISTKIPP